jgi:hypothetical protein
VQVDSIKTRVESAPGVCNQRLKQKCDEPLSNVAFNLNLRRYSEADAAAAEMRAGIAALQAQVAAHTAGEVQLASIKTRVKSAPDVRNQRLKLTCDEPLSKVPFNSNVRRYITAAVDARRSEMDDAAAAAAQELDNVKHEALGRAVHVDSLSVSKPVLTAPLVSALETKM